MMPGNHNHLKKDVQFHPDIMPDPSTYVATNVGDFHNVSSPISVENFTATHNAVLMQPLTAIVMRDAANLARTNVDAYNAPHLPPMATTIHRAG